MTTAGSAATSTCGGCTASAAVAACKEAAVVASGPAMPPSPDPITAPYNRAGGGGVAVHCHWDIDACPALATEAEP